MLQIDLSNAITELKKKKAKKVFVQVPEGLKVKTEGIIEELEKKGFEAITAMDPCFGACDIKQQEAKRMGCTAILHLGHTAFVEKTSIPVVYSPLKYDLGELFSRSMNAIKEYLKDEEINESCIVTTAQFLHYLPEIKKELEKSKIKVHIEKGKRVNPGQVLGCNYSAAETKAQNIIYFGDGLFHPLGIHFATGKKVILANPLDLQVRELEEEKEQFIRKRIMLIERAKQANNIAIIVSTKEGQNRISDAERIKKELEKKGKTVKIYTMDYISQEALLGITAEAYINTACPRISIDDYAQYKQPIINYPEVEYLLGKKSYEEYKLKTIY
jgi:2-(3-amino-3-carboxypropyl)histidine synthase